MQVHVAKPHADRPPLRCPLLVRTAFPGFQDARFQPTPYQAQQARISDSMLDGSGAAIRGPDSRRSSSNPPPAPSSPCAQQPPLVEGGQSVVRAQPRSSTEGTRQEILLVDGGQHLGGAALERPVSDTGHAQGALLLLGLTWGYTPARWPVHDTPGGARPRAWAQSRPRSSPSPPSGHRHAGGTNPGSTPGHSPMRALGFRLPHRETGSAASTTFDFGDLTVEKGCVDPAVELIDVHRVDALDDPPTSGRQPSLPGRGYPWNWRREPALCFGNSHRPRKPTSWVRTTELYLKERTTDSAVPPTF